MPDSPATDADPDSDLAIQTQNLRKVYGGPGSANGKGFVAVGDLSLNVPRGRIFGFLGPNGAGKTTTINMLLGNVYPSGGSGRLLGKPLGDLGARRSLGFLPEKFQFHEFLTAEEFLDMHGRLYGMPAVERRRAAGLALERVGLSARRKSRIREFSKGMQQRVGLAQAILNRPELIILDEPTSALDPLGRRDVRNLLGELKAEGVTIFLNSHLLSEIEMTCDQVAIIKAGRVIRQGAMDELLSARATVDARIAGLSDPLLRALEEIAAGPITVDGDRVSIALKDEAALGAVAPIVVRGGGTLLCLAPRRESLEDLFIRTIDAEAAEPSVPMPTVSAQ